MHIGETAVTHNEHMIARSGGGAHGADQRIHFIKGLGASGERRERRLQIPAERMAARCRAIPENQVGAFITPSFIVFERGSSTARIRACAPTRARKATMVARMALG